MQRSECIRGLNELFVRRLILCSKRRISSEINGFSIMFCNKCCRSFKRVIQFLIINIHSSSWEKKQVGAVLAKVEYIFVGLISRGRERFRSIHFQYAERRYPTTDKLGEISWFRRSSMPWVRRWVSPHDWDMRDTLRSIARDLSPELVLVLLMSTLSQNQHRMHKKEGEEATLFGEFRN